MKETLAPTQGLDGRPIFTCVTTVDQTCPLGQPDGLSNTKSLSYLEPSTVDGPLVQDARIYSLGMSRCQRARGPECQSQATKIAPHIRNEMIIIIIRTSPGRRPQLHPIPWRQTRLGCGTSDVLGKASDPALQHAARSL